MNMEDELYSVTKKSGMVFLGRVFELILGFMFSLVVARNLGPDIYGQFVYVSNFISFLSLAALLGLDQGAVYFIPKLNSDSNSKEKGSLISFIYALPLTLSIIFVIIVSLNRNSIATLFLNDSNLSQLVGILSPFMVLSVLMPCMFGVLRAIGQIKHYIISYNIIIPITKLVIILILSYLGYKQLGIIAAVYISFIIGIIYLIIKVDNLKVMGALNTKYMSTYIDTIKFSFPLFLTLSLSFLMRKTDEFMIGYFLPSSHLGIYNIAIKISAVSGFILIAFSTIFAPLVSSLHHKGEMKKLSDIYKVITSWILCFNLIILSIIFIFGRDILHIFGEEFSMGFLVLIFLTMQEVANAAVGPAGMFNIMTGHPQYSLFINLFVLALNIFMNYLLIPLYGINGAAFASYVSIFIASTIKIALLYKDHRVHPFNMNYLKVIAISILCFFVTYIANNIISINRWFNMAFLSLLHVVIFIFLYYFFGASETDKLIFKKIKQRIIYQE